MKYKVSMNVSSITVDGVSFPVKREGKERIVEIPDKYKVKLSILKPIVEEIVEETSEEVVEDNKKEKKPVSKSKK